MTHMMQKQIRPTKMSTPLSKSNHTTLGHSGGKWCDHYGCSLSGSECLHRCCDCRRVVQVRECIPPRPIAPEVLFHILDEVPHPFTGVVACTVVVDIAKRPLNRIGIRAVGW